MIDTTATLGDLVTEDHRRAAVLERLGLDYCCNGGRSLAQAAAEAHVDADEVARALDLPMRPDAPGWQSLGMAELARHIIDRHHTYLWDGLEPLRALVDKVARVHGERHPELAGVQADYHALADDLASHLMKEERILFPVILELDALGATSMHCGVEGPVRQMMVEHDVAGDLLRRLRAATSDYTAPADGCASYQLMMTQLAELEADLHEHIHKENNVLFPRALAVGGASAS